jgi:outer membrane lipoprotein-sorting protein
MVMSRFALAATTLLLIGLILGCIRTAGIAAEPAAPAAEPAAPPAEPPPAPEVVAVLDKMEAAGNEFKTIRAKFDYELKQPLYDDVQKRKGELMYESPNHLRFEFLDKPMELFVFDGRVLFNRKDATKQLMIWELRQPNEPPVQALALGQTPFPVPFGQKKADVLKYFTVTRDAKEEAADKDKRSVLVLVPKKDTPLAKNYTKILLWVDAKGLVTRAKLFDPSANETTIDFHDIKTNENLDPKLFTRPDVPQNWETVYPKTGR